MRFSRREILRLGAGALAVGASGGRLRTSAAATPNRIPTSAYSSDVATEWFALALDLVRETPGCSPPVASRALGYIGVALYESVVGGMPDHDSLAGKLNDLSAIRSYWPRWTHWPAVANRAIAEMVRDLFPTASAANHFRVDALEDAQTETFARSHSRGLLHRSATLGQEVADHIIEWARKDGGHEGFLSNFPAGYVPPVGPGYWIPTPPGFQVAMQPYWGNNRPFVMEHPAQFDPGSPPPFSTDPESSCYQEAIEVYESVNNLTSEQLDIARFWADDPGETSTPPGHSLSIATQILEQRQATLAKAAEVYARAGVAVADAFISCWDTKYRYSLIRPISYIQTYIDASWGNPLPVATPPFPEYTSGHSVQTAAFAQVMYDLFGDIAFTDHTHDRLGMSPRSFKTWFEMGNETAISRLYGGIHFRSAIELGVEQGKQLGRMVGHAFGDERRPRGR